MPAEATSPSSICSSCGNELESSGDCNVCLLQLGISHAGSGEVLPSGETLPSVEELNAQFPQLEVTRLIGQGGMGAIYHARQTALDRDVALKLIRKNVSSDVSFAERFEREAKTLAKLSHPHIVTIFDFGRTPDGIAYLIMEYVDGINLREAMANGSVGADEALTVVSTICGALEYAHSKGVIHRDIKPENILLGEDGALKVADFGIAKIIDESVRTPTLTATRQVLGSLHYLAPEHLESPADVDHRVDLYALGVIFYELLAGQLPLGRFESPSAVRENVDYRLDPIVLKMLSRKPGRRYQNAAEIDSDIQEVLTSNNEARRPVDAVAIDPTRSPQGKRRASVHFTCEAMGGFAEAVGFLHARGDLLRAEFRIRDSIWGHLKSDTHVVEIPRDSLTRLEIVNGVFSTKLVVSTDSLTALGKFPNAETGRVELGIKRNDVAFARQVVGSLGFDAGPGDPRELTAQSQKPVDAKRMTFALLMILCGILNAGALAILQVSFHEELRDLEFITLAVAAAVLLGPIAVLQIVTGIINLIGRPRSLNVAVAIVSMLPLSPIWILSFPIGVWAYRWLNPGQSASPGKKSWGSTTLLFIRESRWSKAIAAANAVGIVLVGLALATFKLGLYPTELRYRIVDNNPQSESLKEALQSRLGGSRGLRGIDCDEPTRLTVRTWQRFRSRIEELLAVEESPQLVWLKSSSQFGESIDETGETDEAGETDESARTARWFPVVPGIDTKAFCAVEQDLGTELQAVSKPFDLSSEFVSRISASPMEVERLLILELTPAGRDAVNLRRSESDGAGGLALVIDGLIEGIATNEFISPKQVVIRLSSMSQWTRDGIAAGIRGPDLPSQLELLDER